MWEKVLYSLFVFITRIRIANPQGLQTLVPKIIEINTLFLQKENKQTNNKESCSFMKKDLGLFKYCVYP